MSGTSVVPYSPRQKKATALAAIDAYSDAEKPLDYSFLNIATLEDVLEECPRDVSLKKGETIQPITEENKCKTQSLRLNNNELASIKLLKEIASKVIVNPSSLGWIDLSFNELTTIDPILLEFENLKTLYLHGNCIARLQEVDKLQGLKNLYKLTLHGNPIEEKAQNFQKEPWGYKPYILSLMPNLLVLDFYRVTKADLKTSETWNKRNCKNKSKKKKDMSDD